MSLLSLSLSLSPYLYLSLHLTLSLILSISLPLTITHPLWLTHYLQLSVFLYRYISLLQIHQIVLAVRWATLLLTGADTSPHTYTFKVRTFFLKEPVYSLYGTQFFTLTEMDRVIVDREI